MNDETFITGSKRALLTVPGIMLVAANLVPLVGVIAWEWSVFDVVVLYWFENVVIGVINILKMLTCAPTGESMNLSKSDAKGLGTAHHLSKFFFVPFFTVHYGLFTMVHGVFVFSLLGNNNGPMTARGFGPFSGMSEMIGEVFQRETFWAALALVASHFISYVYHFFIRGEFRRVAVPQLMFAPYGRIVVLHVAILGGAFAIDALGSPVILLLILIVGKIAIDLGLHYRAHRKLEAHRDKTI